MEKCDCVVMEKWDCSLERGLWLKLKCKYMMAPCIRCHQTRFTHQSQGLMLHTNLKNRKHRRIDWEYLLYLLGVWRLLRETSRSSQAFPNIFILPSVKFIFNQLLSITNSIHCIASDCLHIFLSCGTLVLIFVTTLLNYQSHILPFNLMHI